MAIAGATMLLCLARFGEISGGARDPALCFVMAGAIVRLSMAWLLQRRMKAALAEGALYVPDPYPTVTHPALGATRFGIAWKLSRLRPGTVMADLARGRYPSSWSSSPCCLRLHCTESSSASRYRT